jgi:hypothetical protein
MSVGTILVTGQILRRPTSLGGDLRVRMCGTIDDEEEADIPMPPGLPAWALDGAVFVARLERSVQTFDDLRRRPGSLHSFKHPREVAPFRPVRPGRLWSANEQRARAKARHLAAHQQRVVALLPKPRHRAPECWFSSCYVSVPMSADYSSRPTEPMTREQLILIRDLHRENTVELLRMFHERKGRRRNGRRKPRWILAVDAAGQ